MSETRERLRRHVDETLRGLELSAADLKNHDCAQHPKITHERWLQCQRECLAMLSGAPDPLFESVKRAREAEIERMKKRYGYP